MSVDPIINKDEALANPQLQNLYSYCHNNSITYLDSDGRRVNPITNKWGGVEIQLHIVICLLELEQLHEIKLIKIGEGPSVYFISGSLSLFCF